MSSASSFVKEKLNSDSNSDKYVNYLINGKQFRRNVLVDPMFKFLFIEHLDNKNQNNMGNRVTLDLINALLMNFEEEKFVSIEFEKTELIPTNKEDKFCVVDFLARTKSDTYVHIEVQLKASINKSQELIKRSQLYWHKIHAAYASKKGDKEYAKSARVITIVLVADKLFDDDIYYRTSSLIYRQCTDENEQSLPRPTIQDVKDSYQYGYIAYFELAKSTDAIEKLRRQYESEGKTAWLKGLKRLNKWLIYLSSYTSQELYDEFMKELEAEGDEFFMYLKNSEQQFMSSNGTMYADYVYGGMTYEEYYRNELEQLNKELAEEKQLRKQKDKELKELIDLVEQQNNKELLESVKKILKKGMISD